MNRIEELVDSFVDCINDSDLTYLDEDEVPPFLRVGDLDDCRQYEWKIQKSDCSNWIHPLQEKLPKLFPPSYYSLVSRYAFPAFEIGPILLFGNTGHDTYWELSKRIFLDGFMSYFLLENGYIQIGNPYFYNYDPICFDTNTQIEKSLEYPIVKIDHEEILSKSKLVVVEEISISFLKFVEDYLRRE